MRQITFQDTHTHTQYFFKKNLVAGDRSAQDAITTLWSNFAATGVPTSNYGPPATTPAYGYQRRQKRQHQHPPPHAAPAPYRNPYGYAPAAAAVAQQGRLPSWAPYQVILVTCLEG